MPSRSYYGKSYHYGFNGKEMDNEIDGTGNTIDYGMRVNDTRIARFLSVDPLTANFPFYTPYQFAGNKPIWAIDLDGAEEWVATENTFGEMQTKSGPLAEGFANENHWMPKNTDLAINGNPNTLTFDFGTKGAEHFKAYGINDVSKLSFRYIPLHSFKASWRGVVEGSWAEKNLFGSKYMINYDGYDLGSFQYRKGFGASWDPTMDSDFGFLGNETDNQGMRNFILYHPEGGISFDDALQDALQGEFLGRDMKEINTTIGQNGISVATLPLNPKFHGPDVQSFRGTYNLSQKQMRDVLTFSNKHGYIPIKGGQPVLMKLSSWDVKINLSQSFAAPLRSVENGAMDVVKKKVENKK